ncbi:type VI secretion system membrane subunit TssM [Halopseudomonas salegens]|uniref:Type VI secretion system protein ImpL n=1 Tax=Halopseudomonas salegens TaxID=1434072 RepID=A0A1H2E0J6_9GAMM|nr:type VI secretion system membrane subunit TssM [Halopseudomonas salegens]SDT88509.1 type VI secretion system protein ImpL [Halopseudomonas salegens]
MMRRLYRLIFNRITFIIIGIIAFTAFIWYAGPLFAFAEWRPLAPVFNRLVVIGVVYFLILLRVLIYFWVAKRMNAKLMNAMAGISKNDGPEDSVHQESIDSISSHFVKAMGQLKTMKMASGNEGFWQRLRKRYVYQLPWYVFIGAPGSGKTTALVNSGLSFPLEESTGKDSIKGIGGTRQCDWWFSDEAVLIDTAGRYTTQDSDASLDKAEWDGFLNLLKKYRPKQPLNGAILTISIQDLLGEDAEGRAQHMKRLRARLNELNSGLGIVLPVYVLVTKADLLGGFNEYFSALNREERAQVWGFTLPCNDNGRVADKAELLREMDQLTKRLHDDLPKLMLHENELSRRARAYSLPQNFANVSPLLCDLVAEVFTNNQFTDNVLLRGVYFTSGTQEGTPFDRVLSVLGNNLGCDARVTLQSSPVKGKSFFLEDLLKKVIFREAHLAGRNLKAERREAFLNYCGHGLVIASLAITCALWISSYKKNTDHLEFVDSKVDFLEGDLDALRETRGQSLYEIIQVLDQMDMLADSRQFVFDQPPYSHRFGLYQGYKVHSASDLKYKATLESTLLPRVIKRLEYILSQPAEGNLEVSYEALKAYLMFYDAMHYDANDLYDFVIADWHANLPASIQGAQRDRMDYHLRNLLFHDYVASPFQLDEGMVKSKRSELAAYSFAHRAYSRIKRSLTEAVTGEFNVAQAAGPQAMLVFSRESGKPLTSGIPLLYTYNGYHKLFLPEISSALGALHREESWVLGNAGHIETDFRDEIFQSSLQRDVKRLYLHEYVNQWEEYLADIRLINTTSMTQSLEVARVLSAPDSPVAQFLRSVAKETHLLAGTQKTSNDQYSLLGRAKMRVTTTMSDVERVAGPDIFQRRGDIEQLELIVDDRFQPIRRMVEGDGGAVPLDSVINMFNDLYMTLSSTDAAARSGVTSATLASPQGVDLTRVRAEAAQLPVPLRTMLENLADASDQQISGSTHKSLSGELESRIGRFCRTAVNGRYPFQRGSSRDVTTADFTRLFSHGGMFDQFFQEHLRQRVDTTAPVWTMRQAGGVNVPVHSFQRAARIRDVMFQHGSAAPQMAFTFKVIEMDASIAFANFDFDGQVFRYAHGPQMQYQVKWPGPRGATQVRVELADSSGQRASVVKEGPWAALRFFDEAENRRSGGPEKFISTFVVNGNKLVLEVTASSVESPFMLSDFTNFRCPVL